MTYQYKKFMRDGSVEIRTGSRTTKQVRTGKTAKDRRRGK
jgi:hypothetical protein